MASALSKQLEHWLAAGIIDAEAAARIRAFEESQSSTERLRWPVLLALALGGVLLCAGVLLFVSAHWDELSPAWRFTLVLLLVAAFPTAASFTVDRFPALSNTFFAIGTVCCGAGIFLAAQIFNLQEHWPNGILLWALGALAGWLLLHNWAQAALLAMLVPAWLAGEWAVRAQRYHMTERMILEGLLLLAITYLSAHRNEDDSAERTGVAWLGGIALLPLGIVTFVESHESWLWSGQSENAPPMLVLAWIISFGGALTLAVALRKRAAWANGVAAIWVLMIGTFGRTSMRQGSSLATFGWDAIGIYFWAALGALGLVAWGLLERRPERINLGVAGFALTILVFYFSNVMDKLGRSASLIGMGVLLIFGGWVLERTRRRLVAQMERSSV